jgi:hypothetical protein
MHRSQNVKAFLRVGILLSALLFALTACNLFNQVNVGWRIDRVDQAGSLATVAYTAWNDGKYDLTGVNLKIGVYATPLGDYVSGWTMPDITLNQNETKSGSIVIDVGLNTASGAAVLAVDMDNPQD